MKVLEERSRPIPKCGSPLPDSNQLAQSKGRTATVSAIGPFCLEAEHAEQRIQQEEGGNARARELQPSVPLDPSTGELIMQKASSPSSSLCAGNRLFAKFVLDLKPSWGVVGTPHP